MVRRATAPLDWLHAIWKDDDTLNGGLGNPDICNGGPGDDAFSIRGTDGCEVIVSIP